MGSVDDFHSKHPETNAWINEGLLSSDPARRSATSPRGRTRGTPRTVMSGLVQRLALRLERSPEDLAKVIPEDTINRTKFPVVERLAPDGKIEFSHDPGIVEGVRGLVHR